MIYILLFTALIMLFTGISVNYYMRYKNGDLTFKDEIINTFDMEETTTYSNYYQRSSKYKNFYTVYHIKRTYDSGRIEIIKEKIYK